MSEQATNQWNVDYSWVWSGDDPTGPATLRVVLQSEIPLTGMLDDFLDTLDQDSNGVHGCGGWALIVESAEEKYAVIDIIAAGEDIADAMEDGATRLYEAFGDTEGIEIQWNQLPKENVSD